MSIANDDTDPPEARCERGIFGGEQLRHPSDYLPVSGPIWEVWLQWNSSTRNRESVAKVLTHPYLHTQDDGGMLAFGTLDPAPWPGCYLLLHMLQRLLPWFSRISPQPKTFEFLVSTLGPGTGRRSGAGPFELHNGCSLGYFQ